MTAAVPTEQAVLVVDDEPASVKLLRITLEERVRVYTATSGEVGMELLRKHPEIALAIVDQRMPGMTGTQFIQRTIEPFPRLMRVILTGYTDIESLIEAINAGQVYRYLTKPWSKDDLVSTVRQGLEMHRLASENARLQEELREANARLRVENVQLKREARGRYRFEEIVGTSPVLRRMLDLVERAVPTESTVLITGETGTGKELVARAIHYNGSRADKPFLAVNCAALVPELLTAELFGHKRGAFTGATEDRKGLFEGAHGGTLFLDEIGDCPLNLQTQLLRVLEEGEVRRVGDTRSIKVDVRVIAATNRDLEKDIEDGKFRRDLFFRLNVFPVRTPALRERKEDLPLLVESILEILRAKSRKPVLGFTVESLAALATHDYPGNIRELRNEVERAFAMAGPGEYVTQDLLSERFADAPVAIGSPSGSLRAAIEQFESDFLREALKARRGNQTRTASELGISRRALIDKLQKYGIR